MAYTLWRAGCGLLGISVRMRSREIPLEERTVITYIVNAIRADPKLPVDLTKLRALIQTTMPSWLDHQAILAQWVAAGRGVEGA
ncbi:hypothetical protein BV25DRAFT_403370 [Artomyces pyxidatus]|uniref:Uncharacterized protein n=1 Tax=Artomyces pyxidatus TaxID=48021 RepID=A0ACB8T6A2_9AGAM|nr:hypothetical protein BV25DRAFT_403370 [Artomyces pyxidatus]